MHMLTRKSSTNLVFFKVFRRVPEANFFRIEFYFPYLRKLHHSSEQSFKNKDFEHRFNKDYREINLIEVILYLS